MKRLLFAIRRWRDQRFLKRLERVFQNNVVKAAPVFDGDVALTGDVIIGASDIYFERKNKSTGITDSKD